MNLLCAGLPGLLDAAGAALPDAEPQGLGVMYSEAPSRTLFLYTDVLGSTAYRPREEDLPIAFRPRVSGRVLVTPDELEANLLGLVESRLLHAGLPDAFTVPSGPYKIVTQPIEGIEPALLVVGFGKGDSVGERELAYLKELGEEVRNLVVRKESPAEELERLRRLEAAEQLLPIFMHVLDVREIFDRLSAITRDLVRHDFATVGMFDEKLTEVSLFARTTNLTVQEHRGPIPYPPAQTRTWLCRFVRDLQAHPVDGNSDPARQGGRCSIRVAIRADERAIGALNFTSCDTAPYTALDLTVAQRVADYIALAVSHQRVAEEGRRAAALAERNARLEVRVKTLTEELDSRTGLRRMTGQSVAWTNAVTQAVKVAATDTTVLLLGESGTGKEIVARFVHRSSRRSHGPFVALNCAALPEQLLEAELFGYERGAYTGATQSKAGQLEQAAGGTLFLDEVGDMSLTAQAKFLRVLQEREFQRLGGTRVLRSDARIIAATNLDLQQAIGQGRFREDLFYRLHVFAIQLPPLRDRVDDIMPLSETFLAEFAEHFGGPPVSVSDAAKRMLLEHGWPGNVRELRNTLERAAILCEGGLITPEHILFATGNRVARATAAFATASTAPGGVASVSRRAPSPPSGSGDLEIVERAAIERALQQSRFNKSKAARALGLTRQQLYVRLRRYGLT